jgi:hypothetical protein
VRLFFRADRERTRETEISTSNAATIEKFDRSVLDTRIFQGCGKRGITPPTRTMHREPRTVCQSQHTCPRAIMLACGRRNWHEAFLLP